MTMQYTLRMCCATLFSWIRFVRILLIMNKKKRQPALEKTLPNQV
jgi:hypothetical protein